jgi:hypothetical protein
MLWREVFALNGRTFYVNPFSGRLSRRFYPPPPPLRGGILADEMGLGKTVELLACLLAHPFPGPRNPPMLNEGYEVWVSNSLPLACLLSCKPTHSFSTRIVGVPEQDLFTRYPRCTHTPWTPCAYCLVDTKSLVPHISRYVSGTVVACRCACTPSS